MPDPLFSDLLERKNKKKRMPRFLLFLVGASIAVLPGLLFLSLVHASAGEVSQHVLSAAVNPVPQQIASTPVSPLATVSASPSVTTINGIDYSKEKFQAMDSCQGLSHANTTSKVVALSFDDGPNGNYTRLLLTILNEYHIHATFFLVGKEVQKYPDVAKAIVQQGSVIGNHGFEHLDSRFLSPSQLENNFLKNSRLIQQTTGDYPLMIRPPYGTCPPAMHKELTSLGYSIITWNDMTDDYQPGTDAATIVQQITKKVQPGSIIGMHDQGLNYQETLKALPQIIKILRGEGYHFVTVPQLLGIQAYR